MVEIPEPGKPYFLTGNSSERLQIAAMQLDGAELARAEQALFAIEDGTWGTWPSLVSVVHGEVEMLLTEDVVLAWRVHPRDSGSALIVFLGHVAAS